MAPVASKAAQQKQQQQQQQQQHHRQQHQQQQQDRPLPPSSDDDLLEAEAPPAFPQPVSSLPRPPAGLQYQYDDAAAAVFPTAAGSFLAGALPVSGGGAGSFTAAAAASEVPPGAAAILQPGAGTAAAAAVVTPFAHTTVDGFPLPYDVAMAPYAAAAAHRANSMLYAGGQMEASLPLLTECGFNGDMVFANRQMRHAFSRKVLGLLTVQLLLTAAVAMPILTKRHVRRFVHLNTWVFFLALVLSMTLLLVLACSEAARRRHPTNLLLLLAFTLAQGALVGTASATYATNVPIVAVLITAAVSLALIVYASQTTMDFTASGGMLYAALVVMLVVTLAEQFLGFNTLHLLIGGCGALLFCAYLVYDVQLQASGESAYAVAPDEYVFGAVNVYTDVINLALYFVQLLTQLHGGHEELH